MDRKVKTGQRLLSVVSNNERMSMQHLKVNVWDVCQLENRKTEIFISPLSIDLHYNRGISF